MSGSVGERGAPASTALALQKAAPEALATCPGLDAYLGELLTARVMASSKCREFGSMRQMSASATTPAFMEEQWHLALAHAGVNVDAFHLLPVPGTAPAGGNKAACYPAGEELFDVEGDLVRGSVLEEANAPERRGQIRIAIYDDVDPDDPVAIAELGAVLRHEIRHGEQRQVCGDALFDLDRLADDIISLKVGDRSDDGGLYRAKPTELDANASASQFLYSEHAAVVDQILAGDDAILAISNTPPGRLEDLPAKTVAFMFVLREVAEDPNRFDDGLPFEQHLARIDPRWGALWLALGRTTP